MNEEERQYYNKFARDARDEYERQMIEFRTTGTFTANQEFVKLPNANVWVRKPSRRNGLEQEISTYETLNFPKRPPSMDEAYAQREQRSIFRRKLRIKGLMDPDGTMQDGLDFEEMFREHQEQKTQQAKDESEKNQNSDGANDDDDIQLEST